MAEVRTRRLELIEKTRAAVRERLTKEISYWDHRAEELRLAEEAGKSKSRLNSTEARKRADELHARLQKRMAQLDLEAQISARPPVALGGFVVVPVGLIAKLTGRPLPDTARHVVDTQISAARAREIVMEIERSLGNIPVDRETEKLGYDVESYDPRAGHLRFIEVKGRASGEDITVTYNEIRYSLNKPDQYILAVVEWLPGGGHRVHYIRKPFGREPDFGVTAVRYSFHELVAKGEVILA